MICLRKDQITTAKHPNSTVELIDTNPATSPDPNPNGSPGFEHYESWIRKLETNPGTNLDITPDTNPETNPDTNPWIRIQI